MIVIFRGISAYRPYDEPTVTLLAPGTNKTTIVMPLLTVPVVMLCVRWSHGWIPLHESPTTAPSKSMAPVWIPLWEGRMREGRREKKKQKNWLTDESEVVLEGGRVEGAKGGVNEEVWGGWVRRFTCSPSRVSICSTVSWNDLLKAGMDLQENWVKSHPIRALAMAWKRWAKTCQELHAAMSEYVIIIHDRLHCLSKKKPPHLSPNSMIGYITHMSAAHIVRCISSHVLLWQ